jgi:6-phosphogluconate dehydrogenase
VKAEIGVFGLATMGQNLARNMASKGIPVSLYNRTAARTEHMMREHGSEGSFSPTFDVASFVDAIRRPRAVLLMVKAGEPVDEAISTLLPHLDKGDLLIDGGNSHFQDTRRRFASLRERGIQYLGSGVSGGEEGALRGPSLMPGGSQEAYQRVEKIFTQIAAQVEGVPCCAYIGADGAGHYAKMVHNGIEYADLQLIAEAYDLMRSALRLDPQTQSQIFREWNQGDLDSYLIQITSEVLAKQDEATGLPLVDVIKDEAEQKGTGKWSSQLALDAGVPANVIAEAVFARLLSAQSERRLEASRVLAGPSGRAEASLVDAIRDALYASKIVAYAQGFEQLDTAATEFGWEMNLATLATIWRGGCIIRARFLDRIREAYEQHPNLPSLLLAPYFRVQMDRCQPSWRLVVRMAVELGVPTPAFAAALTYYDGYRQAGGPANLIQGLRDYFGAHTYRRVDRAGSFHTQWGQDGHEVEA